MGNGFGGVPSAGLAKSGAGSLGARGDPGGAVDRGGVCGAGIFQVPGKPRRQKPDVATQGRENPAPLLMHPDLIPGVFIAIVMVHLAIMGVLCHRAGIMFDPQYFLLFVPQAIMFGLFSIVDLPLEMRGFWVRVSAVLVPACLDVLLVMAYRRRRK